MIIGQDLAYFLFYLSDKMYFLSTEQYPGNVGQAAYNINFCNVKIRN